jgi:hypothetical protein
MENTPINGQVNRTRYFIQMKSQDIECYDGVDDDEGAAITWLVPEPLSLYERAQR